MKELLSNNFEDLKVKLLKMNIGDRLRCLWGVRILYTDATGKNRMTDYCLSIDKHSNDKYTVCSCFDFRGHELFWDALEDSGVKKWYHFKDFAVNLYYEEMLMVLESMPKFFNKKEYVGDGKVWKFITFDKDECEKKCEELRKPYEIDTLEKALKIIESGIDSIDEIKERLNKLKNN